LEGVDLNLKTR